MLKIFVIGVGIAVILGAGVVAYLQAQKGDTPGEPNAAGPYTAAEVAEHEGEASCWSIINSAVYDLTSWIPEHPGGSQAILRLCGTDGSEKFNNQHGGQEPMESILAGFKIGELAQ